MTGLLAGKSILVTGLLTKASIAFSVAKLAQEQGAQVIITGYGRMAMVERAAASLPQEAPVLELDVTDPEQLTALAERVTAHAARLDGVLHAIAFAPPPALSGDFLATGWQDVASTFHVSVYSLQALTAALRPLLRPGSSIVGVDFDAAVAWPSFDWMGVAKAGLESCARYLARDLGPHGVRVNLVAAGPLRTVAARGVPGFEDIAAAWKQRSPLGWDAADADGAARTCVALMSDWMPTTTGEIIHADGGFHAVGM